MSVICDHALMFWVVWYLFQVLNREVAGIRDGLELWDIRRTLTSDILPIDSMEEGMRHDLMGAVTTQSCLWCTDHSIMRIRGMEDRVSHVESGRPSSNA